jgi:hypothetical protein
VTLPGWLSKPCRGSSTFIGARGLWASSCHFGRNHQHDFTFAETPSTTKFSAGNGALLYKFINSSRMHLQQARDLGRVENFVHRRTIPSRCSPGLPRFAQSAAMLPANLRFGIKRKNFNAEDFREFLEGTINSAGILTK